MSKGFAKYLVAGSTTGGKFWQVEVTGSDVRTRFGKLAVDAPWSTKSLASPAAATQPAEKLAREKLRKGYAEAPSPNTTKPAKKSAARSAVTLATTPVTGVFYFRAWDRYPGGNADMFTIKVTLTATPGKSPVVTATYHCNFDGSQWRYPEAPLRLTGAKKAVQDLLAAAQAAIDAGIREPRCTVVESRYDNEESDTEWSSLEFSLSVHDRGAPAEGNLAFHLVQKAVTGARAKAAAPDEHSQAFMAAVHRLAGIDRVFAFSDGVDAFSKAYKPKAKGQAQGLRRTAVPLYL